MTSQNKKNKGPDRYAPGVTIYNDSGELVRLSLAQRFARSLSREWQLWLLLLPLLTALILFNYLPLYGIQIAFRDYKAVHGIMGSKWVGLKHFRDFFNAYYAGRLLMNTFLLNVYSLLFSMPVPVILAIMLNQLTYKRFKKSIQTIIYVPHFISTVILAGMMFLFLSPNSGIISKAITALGGTPPYFMMEANWFRPLFVITNIWQHAGWGAIVYIAALTSIDQELYEAASVDGASKLQKILHIDLPHLMPIFIMMLILNCGSILVSNTDKALVMQTPGNMAKSDLIGVYVYSQGLGRAQFSYTAAINLLVNVINFITIVTVNWISRRMGDTSLF